MNENTHRVLVGCTIILEVVAGRMLDQVDDKTTELWRYLLNRLSLQVSVASETLNDLVDLVPPACGGDLPDPWKTPLDDGLSSLEVLTVFRRAQAYNIEIRQFSFDELRALVSTKERMFLW